MKTKNKVFIATSMDGYIADKNGGIEWLDSIPELNQIDTGYHRFMEEVDAVVMGRTTFETVLGFGIDWPYQKPVFVLSTSLKNVPAELEGRVEIVSGDLQKVLEQIHQKGFYRLYIDGGRTIQSFLREDLIDELTITVIPYVLGGGTPLFGDLSDKMTFACVNSEIFLRSVVQNQFVRKR